MAKLKPNITFDGTMTDPPPYPRERGHFAAWKGAAARASGARGGQDRRSGGGLPTPAPPAPRASYFFVFFKYILVEFGSVSDPPQALVAAI